MLDLRIPGLPDWAALALLVFGLTILLAWMLMPFSVFGVKGRIEALEAQLEVMHAELRQLNARLSQPPGPRAADFAMPAESPILRPDIGAIHEPRAAPPIPPPPVVPERSVRIPPQLKPEPIMPQPGRAEPKLSWPPRA